MADTKWSETEQITTYSKCARLPILDTKCELRECDDDYLLNYTIAVSNLIGDGKLSINAENSVVSTFTANLDTNSQINFFGGKNIVLEVSNNSITIHSPYSGEGGSGGMVEVTYTELILIKNKSLLIPGTFYKITDYICTTTQTDTLAKNHRFDIIVLALSSNELSEDAWAAHHKFTSEELELYPEEVLYFSESNLQAWKLKYCLDNDIKYAWADTINGKGIIYWMLDEFGNECSYDFKNIQYCNITYLNGVEIKTDSDYHYTFSNGFYNAEAKDTSIQYDSYCRNNKIQSYEIQNYSIPRIKKYLPKNIFISDNNRNNILLLNCHDNTLNSSCLNNILYSECYNNYITSSNNNIIFNKSSYNLIYLSDYNNIKFVGNQNKIFYSSFNKIESRTSSNYLIYSNYCIIGEDSSDNLIVGTTSIACEYNIILSFCLSCSIKQSSNNTIGTNSDSCLITMDANNVLLLGNNTQVYIGLPTRQETDNLTNITISQGCSNVKVVATKNNPRKNIIIDYGVTGTIIPANYASVSGTTRICSKNNQHIYI